MSLSEGKEYCGTSRILAAVRREDGLRGKNRRSKTFPFCLFLKYLFLHTFCCPKNQVWKFDFYIQSYKREENHYKHHSFSSDSLV